MLPLNDCSLCPRLASFRQKNVSTCVGYFNAPVPSFGESAARLLVVGLAPGLQGANRTGRPFTGDYAGMILYEALERAGLALGKYDPEQVFKKKAHDADGFTLKNVRITNAVRCVPPENKPEPSEIKSCNAFLKSELHAMPNLRVIISLGLISHQAVLSATGMKKSKYVFEHAKEHEIKLNGRSVKLIDSYHTSRYNINTRRLTPEMFDKVIALAKKHISVD